MFSLVSVSDKNLTFLHFNHKTQEELIFCYFKVDMELLEAHKLRLGQVVVVQVETNITFLSFLVFCHLITLNSFFNAQSKGLSFRFCQLIKLNTWSQIVSIRKARLHCHFDQIKTLLRDRFDQESKAPVVPAQIALQRRQFAQNMDFVSAVHIRWAGARV